VSKKYREIDIRMLKKKKRWQCAKDYEGKDQNRTRHGLEWDVTKFLILRSRPGQHTATILTRLSMRGPHSSSPCLWLRLSKDSEPTHPWDSEYCIGSHKASQWNATEIV
jgi:hypothetical protein